MIQNAFNSGEITPLCHHRYDLASYASSVARMENFRALLHGGATRDPGLTHLGFPLANQQPHLLEFEFSTTQRFILEFTPGKLRFWTTGDHPAPLPIVLDTPYSLADIQRTTFTRLNDLVYFANRQHPPQLLRRTATDTFEWSQMQFLHPPMDEQNSDPDHRLTADISDVATAPEWLDATAYPTGTPVKYSGIFYICNKTHTSTLATRPDKNATFRALQEQRRGNRSLFVQVNLPYWQIASDEPLAPQGSEVSLQSTVDFFNPLSIGEVLELSFRRSIEERRRRVDILASTIITSKHIDCDGEFTIATTGNWAGSIAVEESQDLGQTWNDILFYESNKDANYNESHTTAGAVLLRLVINSTGTIANKPRVTLTVSDPFTRTAVRIDAFSTPRLATVTALAPIRGREVSLWARASFSQTHGYPAAVAFHRQRLIFGGTTAAPQKIWASAIDQYDVFRRQELADEGTDPDRSFQFNIVSVAQNRILWLASQKDLVVGTSAGEFVIAGNQQSGMFEAGSYQVIPLSHHGCAPLHPIESENGLIFLQRGGRKIRHIGSLTDIAFTPPDLDELSIFGEHLTRHGVVSHAYQRRPDPTYWICDAQGGLHGYTHHPAQRVLAWHTHPLGPLAKAVSVAVTYSDMEEDQVFLAVEHLTPGGSVFAIERFAIGQRQAQEAGDSPAYRYLHHHTATTQEAGSLTLAPVPHLAGKRLTLALDGNAIARDLDPTLQHTIHLPFPGTVVIGVPYRSEIETLPPVVQTSGGTLAFLQVAQLGKLILLPWRSSTARIKHSGNPKEIPLLSRKPSQPFNQPTDLASTPIQVDGVGSAGDRPTLTLIADDPLPFTLLSLHYDILPRQR